jgi:hypothetical protein
MRRKRVLVGLAILVPVFLFLLRPADEAAAGPKTKQGQGIIIELDNKFIKDHENRATITSEFTIAGISAVHKPKNDGEVHIGGWAHDAGLPCVSEVMNAANLGKKAVDVFRKALSAKQKVTVTGAWRLWCEHAGLGDQVQAIGTEPSFPLAGEAASNPDHVFEIHPVTTVKVGDKTTPATNAITSTPGHTPHDAHKAFLQGYETLPCKITSKNGRTRITTRALGFNFTEFRIRLDEDPKPLEDGHGVICTVSDTDGELLVRSRRMVFMKGTDADDRLQGLTKGKRMQVIGIPRISLKLVQWRLTTKEKFDTSPLSWNLPYEMIIVSATRLDEDE